MTEDNDVRASRPCLLHRGALYTVAATLVVAAAAPVWADGGHGSRGANGSHGNNASKNTAQQHTASSHQQKSSNARTTSGPSGNNGTVKIHDIAGDTSPHNVPHVSCQFWVAFFGFDQGQTLNVSFTGQAPTGAGVPVSINGATTTLVAPTPASGAGHDFDGDLGFTTSELGLSALGPAAKQGYHLKLAVATGSGGGFKYKVFWLQPCAGAPTTTVGGVVTSAAGASNTGATVLGEHFTRTSSAALTTKATTTSAVPGAHVLGESFTRSSGLPFTGANITAMVLDALLMLGIGSALTVIARRRRTGAIG